MIDIGKNRRTQQKLFIISYTILLFTIMVFSYTYIYIYTHNGMASIKFNDIV
jgi:hypothetical protein